ncbi:unnamed protein product [Victoria cruziana]
MAPRRPRSARRVEIYRLVRQSQGMTDEQLRYKARAFLLGTQDRSGSVLFLKLFYVHADRRLLACRNRDSSSGYAGKADIDLSPCLIGQLEPVRDPVAAPISWMGISRRFVGAKVHAVIARRRVCLL